MPKIAILLLLESFPLPRVVPVKEYQSRSDGGEQDAHEVPPKEPWNRHKPVTENDNSYTTGFITAVTGSHWHTILDWAQRSHIRYAGL